MEHAQRAKGIPERPMFSVVCLNPYFNGTCSKSRGLAFNLSNHGRLNPYFNGTCSKRNRTTMKLSEFMVLILILMEHAQRVIATLK